MGAGTGARIGRFEVLSRIGVGGMGEVFRAKITDTAVPFEVALKFIRPEFTSDPHFRKMFVAEAKIGALLSHPNIVRLVDFGEIDFGQARLGVPYLALELVDGLSLDKLVMQGPIEPSVAVYIVLEILAALDYAHNLIGPRQEPLHLVHRDVSTPNVLVSKAGEVKLTDFGVVRAAGVSLTMTNEIKGKRAYMAPEQLKGEKQMDARVDIFATGVLLHHLIVGKPPFNDVADWLLSGAPPVTDVPFADVIAKAMAEKPDKRFQRATEFALRLRQVCPEAVTMKAELATLISESGAGESPLAALDQLIIAQLAPDEDNPNQLAAEQEIILPDWVSTPGKQLRERSFFAYSDDPSQAPPPRKTSFVTLAFAAAVGLLIGVSWLYYQSTLSAEEAANAPVGGAEANKAEANKAEANKAEANKAEANKAEANKAEAKTPEVTSPTVANKSANKKSTSAAAAPGYLTLVTEPWAIAYHNGKRLGATPFARVSLPAGNQEIELDVKDSGKRQPLRVKIASGEETRRSVRLDSDGK